MVVCIIANLDMTAGFYMRQWQHAYHTCMHIRLSIYEGLQEVGESVGGAQTSLIS